MSLKPQEVTGYLPDEAEDENGEKVSIGKGEGMKRAFTGADIVVIPAGIPRMKYSLIVNSQFS